MSEAVIVALITAGVSLFGTVVTVLASSKASAEKVQGQINLVQNEIKTLSDRVEKHNKVIDRTYSLEARMAVVESKVKGEHQ